MSHLLGKIIGTKNFALLIAAKMCLTRKKIQGNQENKHMCTTLADIFHDPQSGGLKTY